MRFPRLLTNRNVTAWVALLVVIVAQCPIPMVMAPPKVVVEGEAFPCQGHACGCDSAAQCWSGCCCFTAQERLAWVRKRGINPPELLIAALAAESTQDKDTAPKCAHCVASKSNKEAKNKSCCDSKSKQVDKDTKIRFVSFVDAMKCRGLSTSVALLPPAVVCESQSAECASPPVLDRLICKDMSASSAILSIDLPPPKAALLG